MAESAGHRLKPIGRAQRSWGWLAALGVAAPLALGACGGGPTLPPYTEQPAATVSLYPEDSLVMFAGDSVTLTAVARDSAGVSLPLRVTDYTWTSSRPDVATVNAGGTVRATQAGGNTRIFARTSSGLGDSLTVQVRAAGPPPFHIALLYAPDVSLIWREALDSAAARWEEVIRGQLPEVQLNTAGGDCPTAEGEPPSPPLTGPERGTRIYVGLSGMFPPGTYAEAVGGPGLQRPLPLPTTILGCITINRDRLGIDPDRLRYVAVHEMGHTLGLVGVIQGFPPDWFDPVTGVYTGPLALEGWRQDVGYVMEQLYVDQGSHWLTGDDVMAFRLSTRISRMTVGALMDLGYTVAWSGAGPY